MDYLMHLDYADSAEPRSQTIAVKPLPQECPHCGHCALTLQRPDNIVFCRNCGEEFEPTLIVG